MALGVALGRGGQGVGILPYEITHGARDELEAVGAGACGDQGEVSRRDDLQDL